jgi:hypothetical protein
MGMAGLIVANSGDETAEYKSGVLWNRVARWHIFEP